MPLKPGPNVLADLERFLREMVYVHRESKGVRIVGEFSEGVEAVAETALRDYFFPPHTHAFKCECGEVKT